MKIGDTNYSLQKRPTDLDKQLLTSTGCSAAEIAANLAASPLAGTVAQALLPFLPEKDRPTVPALARAIAAAGITEVAGEVRKLYADADTTAVAGQQATGA